jgi:hypothetical protein
MQHTDDSVALAAQVAAILVASLPPGRRSRRIIAGLRLTCEDVRDSVDAAVDELSVAASKLQYYGHRELRPSKLVLHTAEHPGPSYYHQQQPAFHAPLNILRALHTLRIIGAELNTMLTQVCTVSNVGVSQLMLCH